MEPMTAMIIASAIAAAAQGGAGYYAGQKAKEAGKLKATEMKRQTYADLLNTALQNQAELQGQGLDSSKRMGGARTRGLMETAANVRDSFR